MSAKRKISDTLSYRALSPETVCEYLSGVKPAASMLGGAPKEWRAREVGDGNLNLVFIVDGPRGSIVVKQALPYVRLVGESWPLPLDRAHYEHSALIEQARHAPALVPEVYFHDADMALSVMEYLSPHIILRKGLTEGKTYPLMAGHIGAFLARTLFFTSDFFMDPEAKRAMTAHFLTNTAMCKITEDLIFDEPYYAAPMNSHTAPQLDDIAAAMRRDTALKRAVQNLKHRFMNAPEALLHGDLHSGSVMVTESDTRVIDPEFAYCGPMGFDVGMFIANLMIAYFAQPAQAPDGSRAAHARWLAAQCEGVWDSFAAEFSKLWQARTGGEIFNARLYQDSPDLARAALEDVLEKIFSDAMGYAGCEIIRRILGLAHTQDFQSVQDTDTRANCERHALTFARRLILERGSFATIGDAVQEMTRAAT